MDRILVIRLTPNRYVLNASFYDPLRLYEQFVVDSLFDLVAPHL
jgi:hypothetical protein